MKSRRSARATALRPQRQVDTRTPREARLPLKDVRQDRYLLRVRRSFAETESRFSGSEWEPVRRAKPHSPSFANHVLPGVRAQDKRALHLRVRFSRKWGRPTLVLPPNPKNLSRFRNLSEVFRPASQNLFAARSDLKLLMPSADVYGRVIDESHRWVPPRWRQLRFSDRCQRSTRVSCASQAQTAGYSRRGVPCGTGQEELHQLP